MVGQSRGKVRPEGGRCDTIRVATATKGDEQGRDRWRAVGHAPAAQNAGVESRPGQFAYVGPTQAAGGPRGGVSPARRETAQVRLMGRKRGWGGECAGQANAGAGPWRVWVRRKGDNVSMEKKAHALQRVRSLQEYSGSHAVPKSSTLSAGGVPPRSGRTHFLPLALQVRCLDLRDEAVPSVPQEPAKTANTASETRRRQMCALRRLRPCVDGCTSMTPARRAWRRLSHQLWREALPLRGPRPRAVADAAQPRLSLFAQQAPQPANRRARWLRWASPAARAVRAAAQP